MGSRRGIPFKVVRVLGLQPALERTRSRLCAAVVAVLTAFVALVLTRCSEDAARDCRNHTLRRCFPAAGTCCTCAVEVAKGLDALSEPSSQEVQMVAKRFPRWRLACKATLGPIEQDEEIVLKVQPRNWDGFYRDDEVDVDGEPLARDGKR